MRPEYPLFKTLGPDDQKLLAEYLALSPRTTCDLALANLFIWRECEVPSITFINGNLCILIESHNEPHYFLEPLGACKLLETLEICLQHAKRVSRAQESLATHLPSARFHVVPLRDHFDYIYEVKSLAELKGKKYDGKRNLIKKFVRLHPGYEFVPLQKAHREQALNLFDRWSIERENGNGEGGTEPPANLACQRHALEQAFMDFDQLNLRGGAIIVSGQIEGFVVASASNPGRVTAHLQYANYRMPGIYQVLLWETCRHIFTTSTYINLEEDLGIPGLRKTKLSYQPYHLEKKFLITLH
jgi:hypothetical protein